MKCPIESRENEILLAYSSGELDAADSAPLVHHLETCAACQAFVREQREVWQALDVWQAAPVSPDFNRRVYQRIEQHVSWWEVLVRPFRPLGLRYAVPVAASAGLVLMAGLLLQHPRTAPELAQRQAALVETLQPEQLESALDEMEALSQLSRPVHADSLDSKM